MNYFEFPEYAGLSQSALMTETKPAHTETVAVSPLSRLVASIHRQAVAPRGFRFVANINAGDRERAQVALRYAANAGDLRLEPLAVDESGHPLAGLALYMRYQLPEPLAFWVLFHSLGQSDAA